MYSCNAYDAVLSLRWSRIVGWKSIFLSVFMSSFPWGLCSLLCSAEVCAVSLGVEVLKKHLLES
jgi:hypothetical protein